jgi:hypothetical protein
MYDVSEIDLAARPGPGRAEVERRKGSALMDTGLVWPLYDPCTARIWVLEST